jgi:hypothetical protein
MEKTASSVASQVVGLLFAKCYHGHEIEDIYIVACMWEMKIHREF